jgi:hypothetical protein
MDLSRTCHKGVSAIRREEAEEVESRGKTWLVELRVEDKGEGKGYKMIGGRRRAGKTRYTNTTVVACRLR